ncbi:alpha/beta hydrolase [Flavobacterium arcticum]|uniref:Alpha/beta hydrolase n=1 Tax=Flavobacterium arcticum TaxID=1784713 RepID=A0A345HEW9_9FLAO|nr:alpha/beta hydrolase [Flavobacterium arcticum]AXG75129.1 alpha/beta hydrolase [Flavobacterium arcticum]KAF2511091.1 alpha/beta hydrolase [Flavobacterium arcticum]
MEKIPVYFMPGLAASPVIFENIKLPEDKFEMFFLEWLLPEAQESLSHYAKRISKNIVHKNPVLIGVSFGGVLVQEIAEVIPTRKVIIVSSVKCNAEFPRRMRFAKLVRAYNVFPTALMERVDWLARFAKGNSFIAKRLRLYEKFLSVRDKKYLDWAFRTIILWDRVAPNDNVVHIHGTADGVFPPQYLKDYIPLQNGTHIMIINKVKWFNENLPKIITAS